MKAWLFTRYGSPEELRLEDVPRPEPASDEVLIRVRAAALNSWDFELMRGNTLANRLMFGLTRPRKISTLGMDIAGVVEAAGSGVRALRPGDEVFGDIHPSGWGGFAEYATARADLLVKKPPPLSFVDAAALPQAGQMALQALRSFAPVQPGQKVLINGAGGGVGTFAVQMARAWGAEVTGVDHGSKLDMLRSLGAAHVLDYTSCDYTRQGQQYDLIVDCNVRGSALKYRRALAPGGTFVAVGGVIPWLLEHLLWGLALKALGAGKKMRILPYVSKSADMEQLAELLQAGQVKPVIERTLPLEGVPEALGLLEKGLVRGKLVIAMD